MNKTLTRSTVAVAGIGLVAVAVPVALAGSAAAKDREVERKGTCSMGSARYDFSVDKERGGRLDVDFDLDSKPGERWRVKLRHGKKVIVKTTRTTDREGEIDVDRTRPNTPGKDKFVARAKNLATGELCRVKIVF
jgi:hypothetical protein